MVYCTKCGTKNEDTATVCVKCGTTLQTVTPVTRRYERRRAEQECFGLPHGGTVVGIAIGAIILVWGFALLAQQSGLVSQQIEVWPIAAIIFGILILAGAIYGMRRRPPP